MKRKNSRTKRTAVVTTVRAIAQERTSAEQTQDYIEALAQGFEAVALMFAALAPALELATIRLTKSLADMLDYYEIERAKVQAEPEPIHATTS